MGESEMEIPMQGKGLKDIMCLINPPAAFNGLFAGGNPLTRPQSVFFAQIIVFNLVSQGFYFLFRPLKQPRFVSNILGGIVISYVLSGYDRSIWTFKAFPKYEIMLPQMWSILGLCYLLFLSSVKMDLTIFKRNAANASFIGLIGVSCSFLTMFALTFILDLDGMNQKATFKAIFSMGMALSRFPDFVNSYTELNMLTSEVGQLAISVTMFSEFLAWFFMLMLMSYMQAGYSGKALAASIGLGLFVLIFIRPLVMWIIKKTPEGKVVKEQYVVLILLLAIQTATVADFIGVIHVGIVLVGLMIPSETALGHTLTEKIEFVVVQIIMPMFYVVTGLFLDLTNFKFQYVYEITFLVLMGCLSKFVGVVIAAMSCNVKQQHAIMLGLMMNVKGPFDVVSFSRWRSNKPPELDQQSYLVFVLSHVIVTAIVVPSTAILYNSYVRIKASTKRKNMRSIQATPENAELRVLCCIRNDETVPGFIAVLKATNPTPFRPLSVIVLHINELVGQAAPTIVPYGDNLGKAKSKRLHQMIQAFENSLNENTLDRLVQVTTFSVTAPYKSMHEYICKLALDEMVPFILVPFHGTTTQDGNAAPSLRGLNGRVQAHAPCTVGILVDRTLKYSMGRPAISIYNVAVVFLGGADDREALSLGIRMSSHPLVSVTVLRITFDDHYFGAHNKTESKLDFRMVDEFKLRNAHNNLAMYMEKWAKDAEDAFSGITSLIKGKYELIIVGRQRQVTRSMSDDLMLNWSENPELGVIGDFIGAEDFCGNITSVLVMQHYEDTRTSRSRNNSRESEEFYPLGSS